MWHFSRSAGTWRLVPPATATEAVPATRSGHSAVASDPAGSTFVVFGGNLRNDLWEYDTATGKWRQLMAQAAVSAARDVVRGATLAAIACAALALL